MTMLIFLLLGFVLGYCWRTPVTHSDHTALMAAFDEGWKARDKHSELDGRAG